MCWILFCVRDKHNPYNVIITCQIGKKWNVLRLRVDSVSYQADQFILGTILFTIILFLLPTTLLYYVVFTSIHLVVLLIQTILSTVAERISVIRLDRMFVMNEAELREGIKFPINSWQFHNYLFSCIQYMKTTSSSESEY